MKKGMIYVANPIVTITMENGDVMKAELYPGIAPNTVNNFISLVKKGFKKLTGKNPQYDENRIMKLWNKKNPQFIGYNCRITAYDLIGDKISMKKDAKVNASNLFIDQDAIRNAPVKNIPESSRKSLKHCIQQ